MRDLFPLCTMEQISQIHYAEHFPFSFHSSVNGVSFDKIYRKLIGKNTLDRFFIRIFDLFGYKYLVCAIVISMQDSYLLNGVTTNLCPEIARRYGVNPDSIERSIRTVISPQYGTTETQRSCAILWDAAISFSRATQSL